MMFYVSMKIDRFLQRQETHFQKEPFIERQHNEDQMVALDYAQPHQGLRHVLTLYIIHARSVLQKTVPLQYYL